MKPNNRLRNLASFVFGLCLWTLATPGLFAQDHTAVVAQAKADLIAAHQDLTGPCGAFLITNLAAFRLASEGYGILEKSGGNNCHGYSVDVVVLRDGRIWDVLANSGGDEDGQGQPIPNTGNVPVWQPGTAVDGNRWRAPLDPSIDPPPAPEPDPTPEPGVDLVPLLQRLDSLESHVGNLQQDVDGLHAYSARLQDLLDRALTKLNALEAKPLPTCRASANLGFARIPVSCTVVP